MKKYTCNSFVSVEKPVELIEKISEKHFESFINSTRKRNVRKNGFTLVLIRILELIAYNYADIKKMKLDKDDKASRYDVYGKAGYIFEFSRDNNNTALLYGDKKVGIKTLNDVMNYLEQNDFMTHENGYCMRKNATGFNPYKLGMEYLNFSKFIEIYDEFFDELNSLFEVVVLTGKVKNTCGMIFDKIAMKLYSITKGLTAHRDSRKPTAGSGIDWLDKLAGQRGLRPAFSFVRAA